MDIHPLAQALNATLERDCPVVMSHLLSEKGKRIFFPAKGIPGQSAEAKGKTYNATIGIALEDDGTPMTLPSLAKEITLDPKDVYPYASTFGKSELRKKWGELIRIKNPSLKAPLSNPVATSGLTHALSVAGYLFIDLGDHVIIPDKLWGNYRLTFEEQFGGILMTFNSFANGGFDTAAFSEALGAPAEGKKKIVLLNFPNNPTGYSPTKEEAKVIVALLKERADAGDKLVVLLDDAYFGLVYEEGVETESLITRLADLHENILAVKIDGATKENFAWGFRVGFVSFGTKGMTDEAAQALEHKAAGVVRGSISNVCHHSQSALLALYSSPTYEQECEEKFKILQSRYRELKRVLAQEKYASYFTPLPFNSGYFMCVKLAEGIDAEQVRLKLLADYDTGIISVGPMLRIAFSSLPEAHIQTVFDNILSVCEEMVSSQLSEVNSQKSAVSSAQS